MVLDNGAKVVQSFEVTGGEASGDLLSQRSGNAPLRVGVLACAYFEYWRMYEGLRAQGALPPRTGPRDMLESP